jgi:hypothetical protein
LQHLSKQDVDGRDKPGHDSGKVVQYDRNALSALLAKARPRRDGAGAAVAVTAWLHPAFYDVSGTTVEVLAIVGKSEAESWLARFGNPE